MQPKNLPSDLPPSDPVAPKWMLTQDQIDHLLESAGSLWPTLVKYKGLASAMLAIAVTLGGLFGRSTVPPVTDVVINNQTLLDEIKKLQEQIEKLQVSGKNDPSKINSTKPLIMTLYSTGVKEAMTLASSKELDEFLQPYGIVVTVDPKTYPPNSKYPFKDAKIGLPCVTLSTIDNQVVDAATYTNVNDLIALVKKNVKKQ